MAKLYELTEQYNNLMELIENPDIPQDMLVESLNTINDELDTKLENIAKIIKSIEVDTKGLKEEEKRLANRRKAKENKISNLKEYVEGAMRSTGVFKVKGKVFTLAIQKNAPSVFIKDLERIPNEYFRVKEEIDKVLLIQHLKEGQVIEGAELKQTESLRIR